MCVCVIRCGCVRGEKGQGGWVGGREREKRGSSGCGWRHPSSGALISHTARRVKQSHIPSKFHRLHIQIFGFSSFRADSGEGGGVGAGGQDRTGVN